MNPADENLAWEVERRLADYLRTEGGREFVETELAKRHARDVRKAAEICARAKDPVFSLTNLALVLSGASKGRLRDIIFVHPVEVLHVDSCRIERVHPSDTLAATGAGYVLLAEVQ